MAVDDLHSLHQQLPEVFDPKPLPPGWDSDWLIISLDSPESAEGLPDIEQLGFDDDTSPNEMAGSRLDDGFGAPMIPQIPGGFPAVPGGDFSSPYPPPDGGEHRGNEGHG